MDPLRPEIPPDLQQAAEAYQDEFQAVEEALAKIYVRRTHNRLVGKSILRWMHESKINNLQVGLTVLTRHKDGSGFHRTLLSEPARSPHARR